MRFEMASAKCRHAVVVVVIVKRCGNSSESCYRVRSEETIVVGQVLEAKASVIAMGIVMVKRDVSASDTTRAEKSR